MERPFIYTIQSTFPILVDKNDECAGLPWDATPLASIQRRWENGKEVKNAIKIIARCGLELEGILGPNATSEEILEMRQLLMKQLRETIITVVSIRSEDETHE